MTAPVTPRDSADVRRDPRRRWRHAALAALAAPAARSRSCRCSASRALLQATLARIAPADGRPGGHVTSSRTGATRRSSEQAPELTGAQPARRALRPQHGRRRRPRRAGHRATRRRRDGRPARRPPGRRRGRASARSWRGRRRAPAPRTRPLVTLGIAADRPGDRLRLHRRRPTRRRPTAAAHTVERFVEKPDPMRRPSCSPGPSGVAWNAGHLRLAARRDPRAARAPRAGHPGVGRATAWPSAGSLTPIYETLPRPRSTTR